MASKRPKARKERLSRDVEALVDTDEEDAGHEDGLITPPPRKRKTTSLDDFDFDSPIADSLKAALASPTEGPVVFTLYFKCEGSVRQPIGFGMYNTMKIRLELLQFVALEEGHFQPFFLNNDIIATRRVSNAVQCVL